MCHVVDHICLRLWTELQQSALFTRQTLMAQSLQSCLTRWLNRSLLLSWLSTNTDVIMTLFTRGVGGSILQRLADPCNLNFHSRIYVSLDFYFETNARTCWSFCLQKQSHLIVTAATLGMTPWWTVTFRACMSSPPLRHQRTMWR